MKKKVISVICALAMTIGLVGCAAAPAAAPAAPAAPAAAPAASAEAAAPAAEAPAEQPATDYPTKPIELIIPWTAGGGTDVAGRLFASLMEKQLGTTINVTNIAGGNSSVGTTEAANSAPDGYTLLLTVFDYVTGDVLQNGAYTLDDFEAIGSFTIQPTVYVVMTKNWASTEDFIAYAKENPGKVTVSNVGEGGAWHQAAVIANNAMGIETTHVPYDGSGEQLAALLGGHTDAAVISYNTVIDYLKNGEMTCIGVMTDERVENIPDCPTFKEQGYDVNYSSFRGIVAPKGLPADVKAKLVDAMNKTCESQEWIDAATQSSLDMWHVDDKGFDEFLQQTKEQCTQVLTELGML